jgi:hypothetical protein
MANEDVKVSADIVEPIFNSIRAVCSEAKFTHYYKYTFTYEVVTDIGTITLSFGGMSDDIYKEEFKPTMEIPQFLELHEFGSDWCWIRVVSAGKLYIQRGSGFAVEEKGVEG